LTANTISSHEPRIRTITGTQKWVSVRIERILKAFKALSGKSVGPNGPQYGDVAALSQEKSIRDAARRGHFRFGFFGRLIKFANRRKDPGTPSGN
jgi:hypothetical protein